MKNKPITRKELAAMIDKSFDRALSRWMDKQKADAPKRIGNLVITAFKLISHWVLVFFLIWLAKEAFGGRGQELADWLVQHS